MSRKQIWVEGLLKILLLSPTYILLVCIIYTYINVYYIKSTIKKYNLDIPIENSKSHYLITNKFIIPNDIALIVYNIN